MNKFALMGIAGAAVASAMVAAPAEAALFTVGGTQYEITTVTGSFDSLESTLMNQVWWNNQTLAVDFASVVEDDLGLPGTTLATPDNDLGPFFAYTSTFAGVWNNTAQTAGNTTFFFQSSVPTFAIATVVEPESVPEPIDALGSGCGWPRGCGLGAQA